MFFPTTRLRRLRQHAHLRRMVRETTLSVDDLIYPLFIVPGQGVKKEVPSMPGVYQFSHDMIAKEVEALSHLGIPAVILFGVPETKDKEGSSAYDPQGVIPQAIKVIKKVNPDLMVITDVCLCEYTDHGHCGLLVEGRYGVTVDNDATLEVLAREALVHVEAGADMVAPSDMMDGRIKAIRETLDKAGFSMVPILAYAAKFASSFYGPFRDAAYSAPSFGDRTTYQMDPPNAREALREVELDIQEGADIVMVKPALAYLDIIFQVRQTFKVPVACYNVSGEYSMVKAAGAKGWLDEKKIALESLMGMKRAGADLILTYWAKDVARWLKEG